MEYCLGSAMNGKEYVLKDLEQIRVLADPLRLKILEALARREMTTKQVAQLLEEKPTRLYRHVNALARVKLIKLVRTQKKRGTLEKYYRAVAGDFAVDRDLFSALPREQAVAAFEDMINGVLRMTLAEIRHSLKSKAIKPGDKGRSVTVLREEVRADQEQILELKAKLQTWVKQLHKAHRKQGELDYRLTLVFYPVQPAQRKTSNKEASS